MYYNLDPEVLLESLIMNHAAPSTSTSTWRWFFPGFPATFRHLQPQLKVKVEAMAVTSNDPWNGQIHWRPIPTWQFFLTFLGWLSDPFKGLSDLQLGYEKVTLNHLVFVELVGGWGFNPSEKYAQVKLEIFIFLNFPGENKTYCKNHHLAIQSNPLLKLFGTLANSVFC